MKIETFKHFFIPAKDKTNEKLMLVMHGLGDSFHGYTWLPDELAQNNLSYLLVNAPEAYFEGFSWYDYEDPVGGQNDLENSYQLLCALLNEIKAAGYQSKDLILFGFSQGCVMCFELGLRYPAKFAGICGISGYLYSDKALVQSRLSEFTTQQNWLITHGYQDSVIPYERAAQDVQFLESLKIPIHFKSFPKAHTIDPYDELPIIQNWVNACCL